MLRRKRTAKLKHYKQSTPAARTYKCRLRVNQELQKSSQTTAASTKLHEESKIKVSIHHI